MSVWRVVVVMELDDMREGCGPWGDPGSPRDDLAHSTALIWAHAPSFV